MMRYTFCIVLAVGLAQGCQPPATKPATTVDTPGVPSPENQSLMDAKPDFKFTAQEWYNEFTKDDAAAKAKYADKVIEVEGTVFLVVEQDSKPPLSLIHLAVEKDFLGVRCGCEPGDLWKTVIPKSNTALRGRYKRGALLKGELYPCVLVKTDSRIDRITVTDLIAERVKDPEAGAVKYRDKWMWVEGKVLEAGVDKNNTPKLILQGQDDIVINCGIPSDDREKLKLLKPGQPIKVFGELTIGADKKISIFMNYVRFVTE